MIELSIVFAIAFAAGYITRIKHESEDKKVKCRPDKTCIMDVTVYKGEMNEVEAKKICDIVHKMQLHSVERNLS